MAPIMLQHPDNENRVVELVRSAIARQDVTRVAFVVAWIQTRAMDEIKEPIRHAAIAKKEIVLIFGDNPQARFHDKPALETLLDLQSRYPNITILRHRAGALFHPKLYYVAGKNDAPANIIIGSANLTGSGLGVNQNRNLNNVEMVVHGNLALDSQDRVDVEREIEFLIKSERSTALDEDWVEKYKQMKTFDKKKKLSLWEKIVKWVKNKFGRNKKSLAKLKGSKTSISNKKRDSKSSPTNYLSSPSEVIDDTSVDDVRINSMTLQGLVNRIEMEVSDESSANYVITRMRERSHGDGNNSSKYLGIVPLTAYFLLEMDDSERRELLEEIRRNTTFSCSDSESWRNIRNSMPSNIKELFRDFVRRSTIQTESIYRIRGGERTVEQIRNVFCDTWGGNTPRAVPPEPRWTLYLIAHRIWNPDVDSA
jgi:HKD family nuclease